MATDPFRKLGSIALGAAAAGATVNEFLRDRGRKAEPSTKFSVETFKSKISNLNSIAKTNRFFVTIEEPKWMALENEDPSFVRDDLMFLCSETVLPGLSFTIAENRRQGTGPLQFHPSSPAFNEVTLSFIGDGRGKVMEFFHKWMQNIILVSEFPAGTNMGRRGALPFELYYRDEYVTPVITIMVYEENQEKIIEYKLHNAWPSSITNVSMNWESEQRMGIDVTFRYDVWTSSALDPLTSVTKVRPLSGLQRIIKSGTAIQTAVGGSRIPQNVGDAINVALNTKAIVDNFNF